MLCLGGNENARNKDSCQIISHSVMGTYHEDRKKQETVRNIAALVFVTPEAIDPSEREIARRIILLAGLPEQGRQTLRH